MNVEALGGLEPASTAAPSLAGLQAAPLRGFRRSPVRSTPSNGRVETQARESCSGVSIRMRSSTSSRGCSKSCATTTSRSERAGSRPARTRGARATWRGSPDGRAVRLDGGFRAEAPQARESEGESVRPRRLRWAELMARVFLEDVLECVRCHGRMRVIACSRASGRHRAGVAVPFSTDQPAAPTLSGAAAAAGRARVSRSELGRMTGASQST